ncbi:MAG: FeoA family protein [Candidatus Bathyarchaeia archaeon]|nr:ferrous iron transport protein A [Candidatus Bathyarchaeota archaeon]
MFRKKFHGPEASGDEGELCVLSDLAEGERGVVVKALGGFGLVRRLAEMGLTPGVEVKLVKKGLFGGPVEVEVRGVMLALGHGVAAKVLVKPVKDEPHD